MSGGILTSIARRTIRLAGYDAQRVETSVLLRPSVVMPEDQARHLLRFIRHHYPELDAVDHIVRILDRYRVNVVIDVGANVGQYAMRLRAGGYRGHIISFEPIQDAFDQLSDHARSDPRWKTYRMALGSTAGELPLYVTRNNGFSSFLAANPDLNRLFGAFTNVERIEMVPVRTLDEAVEDIGAQIESARFFLKLDTQGYDLQIFANAVTALPRMLGVQTELSVLPLYDAMANWLDVTTFLQRAGFAIAGLSPVNQDPATLQVVEFDGLFVRPECA